MLLRFLLPLPTFRLQCHMLSFRMPHVSKANATPQQVKWLAFGVLKCGIQDVKLWSLHHLFQGNRPCVEGKQTIRSEQTDHPFRCGKR